MSAPCDGTVAAVAVPSVGKLSALCYSTLVDSAVVISPPDMDFKPILLTFISLFCCFKLGYRVVEGALLVTLN